MNFENPTLEKNDLIPSETIKEIQKEIEAKEFDLGEEDIKDYLEKLNEQSLDLDEAINKFKEIIDNSEVGDDIKKNLNTFFE